MARLTVRMETRRAWWLTCLYPVALEAVIAATWCRIIDWDSAMALYTWLVFRGTRWRTSKHHAWNRRLGPGLTVWYGHPGPGLTVRWCKRFRRVSKLAGEARWFADLGRRFVRGWFDGED